MTDSTSDSTTNYDNSRREAIALGREIAKQANEFLIEEEIHPDSLEEALRRLKKCYEYLDKAKRALVYAQKAANEDARVRNQRKRRRRLK